MQAHVMPWVTLGNLWVTLNFNWGLRQTDRQADGHTDIRTCKAASSQLKNLKRNNTYKTHLTMVTQNVKIKFS